MGTHVHAVKVIYTLKYGEPNINEEILYHVWWHLFSLLERTTPRRADKNAIHFSAFKGIFSHRLSLLHSVLVQC